MNLSTDRDGWVEVFARKVFSWIGGDGFCTRGLPAHVGLHFTSR